jgi:hypothetical protein
MTTATDSSAGVATLRCVRLWMSQRGTDPHSEYGGKSCSAAMGFWLSIAILMNHRDPEAQRIQGSKTAPCYSLAFRLSLFAEDYWQNPKANVPRYIKADPSGLKPLRMRKTKRTARLKSRPDTNLIRASFSANREP